MTTEAYGSRWDEVYEGLRLELVTQAHRITGNRDDAEDVVHDVYLKALEFTGRGGTLRQAEHWLRRAVRNAAIDRIRMRRTTSAAVDGDVAGPPLPDAGLALDACLAPLTHALPAIYADALSRTDLGEWRMQDLAAHHGIGVSAAKSRVQRARSQLAQEIRRCCEAVAGPTEPFLRSLGQSPCCPVAGTLTAAAASTGKCCD